jgi:hypothetical protein
MYLENIYLLKMNQYKKHFALKSNYGLFLQKIKDVQYKEINNDKDMYFTVKIIYELTCIIQSSDDRNNILKLFIHDYGINRLNEIYICWTFIINDDIPPYVKNLMNNISSNFRDDLVKFMVYENIHTELKAIDIVNFVENNNVCYAFYYYIISYPNQNDNYYLSLLDHFHKNCDNSLLLNICNNVLDKNALFKFIFKELDLKTICRVLGYYKKRNGLTNEHLDDFCISYINNKYERFGLLRQVLRVFERHNIFISYDLYPELVKLNIFIISQVNMNYKLYNDICDIVCKYSKDNVKTLKTLIKNGYYWNNDTMRIARESGNNKCEKYLNKLINIH